MATRFGEISAADFERALDAWADFPVGADRRPVVLTGPMVVGPRDGFRTTALKEAFCDGDYVHPPWLPGSAPNALGYAIVDAHAGLARLEAGGDGQGSPAPLHITSLHLGSAAFETDRGRAELPAWLVTFDEVQYPAAVLALEPPELFQRPGPPPYFPPQYSARPGPDDDTIDVIFLGGPPTLTTYVADVVEAPHAIAIHVRQLSSTPPSGGNTITGRVGWTRVGHGHVITTPLTAPVANRVLIDPYTWAPAAFANN